MYMIHRNPVDHCMRMLMCMQTCYCQQLNWGWGRRVFLKSLSKSSNYYFNGHVKCNLQLTIKITHPPLPKSNLIKEIHVSHFQECNMIFYWNPKLYISLIMSGAFLSLRDIMCLNLNISLINIWNLQASLNTKCI